jgi:hypothetical protein
LQAVPEQASATGLERPPGGTADPDFPGSAAVGLDSLVPQELVNLTADRAFIFNLVRAAARRSAFASVVTERGEAATGQRQVRPPP